jgi:nucleoside-diphosphate-sugar epimerase
MSRNILITGVSGYLGGTLLNSLPTANLPPHGEIYALVRTAEQAEAVKDYGVKPLLFNAYDSAAVEENVVRHSISIVFWLVDALGVDAQTYFIQALAKVKRETGLEVHFLLVCFFRHSAGRCYFWEHRIVYKE